MPENPFFHSSFISKIRAAEKAEILQPIEVGKTNNENELVFFVKPELLDVQDDAKNRKQPEIDPGKI